MHWAGEARFGVPIDFIDDSGDGLSPIRSGGLQAAVVVTNLWLAEKHFGLANGIPSGGDQSNNASASQSLTHLRSLSTCKQLRRSLK